MRPQRAAGAGNAAMKTTGNGPARALGKTCLHVTAGSVYTYTELSAFVRMKLGGTAEVKAPVLELS